MLANGNHVLCPYCLSDIAEDTGDCPVCGLDTTRDAKIELTPQQYRDEPRQPCVACGRLIIKLTVICPHCLAEQPKPLT